MNWVRGLRSILFMTCRDAAPLISQTLDRDLPPLDRTAVRLHLSICPSCRRYRGQLTLLRRVLAFMAERLAAPAGDRLSPEARRRLRLNLSRAAGGNGRPGP